MVLATACKFIERTFGDADDVIFNECGAFRCPLFRMLQATLPFHHGPALVVVLSKLGEDRFEVHLAVAQGPESSGAVHPVLIAAIDTGSTCGIKLRVLDMKDLDEVMIEVDVLQIIQGS